VKSRASSPNPTLRSKPRFESDKGTYKGTFYAAPEEGLRDERGRLRAFQPLRARLPVDDELAERVAQRARSGHAAVHAIEQTARRTPPPQLFDLTELQKEANRLYGLTAQVTLDAAQELYEVHKALSYPRTDCRYLSATVARTLPNIVQTIAPRYTGLVAPASGTVPGSRWVNDAKIGDHHALIPTTQLPKQLAPDSPAARVYDLVCRRTLMMWHAELVEAVTRLLTEVRSPDATDLFATQGTSVEARGWTVLEPRSASREARDQPPKIPGGLAQGAAQAVKEVTVHRKATRPPQAHTEASLAAMESAGRAIEDEALREAMRDSGLGTPATRAATIETLLKRGYLSRHGKALTSTTTGQALVAAVSPDVASPEMTGRWEKRLRAMEQERESFDTFMRDIARFVRHAVDTEAQKPLGQRQVSQSAAQRPKRRARSKLRYANQRPARPPS
jgi:DNA topoisomerase III